MKLLKGKTEQLIKARLEKIGCTFLKINWNKKTCHYLTKGGVKKTHVVV